MRTACEKVIKILKMATQNTDPAVTATSTRSKDMDNGTLCSNDNHSVSKRLQKELLSLLTSGIAGISAFPDGDNIFKWIGTITGAKGTVYEGLVYKLDLEFPSSYPYKAPTVKFTTPCYHPNVDQHGNICLDILKEKWSASYDVKAVLLSIQSLLGEPNNESPLNAHAADLWDNQVAFKKLLLETYDEQARISKS